MTIKPQGVTPTNGKAQTNTPLAIEVKNLTVSYGSKPALLDVNIDIKQGQLIGIIGPNGSGKSTFIKSILGFVKRDFGTINILGFPIEKAKGLVAYVPQRGAVDWDFPITVYEVAMMGRYNKIKWYKSPSKNDIEVVNDCLEMVRMSEFKDRQIGQLSGGQQQRVFMARALAQGAELLLLDEPFAGVDAATERSILDVLARAKNAGKTLVVVHHDLATAAEYFDQLLLIKQRVFAYGPPKVVLQESLLTEVYEGQLQVFSQLNAQAQ